MLIQRAIFIFICMTVAVSSQSSDTGEQIRNLVCSNNECTPADNSSASHLSSYLGCIVHYNSEFAYRSCNFSVPLNVQSYPFCALRENEVFCSEILNAESEIPSACSDTSMCTSECRAALQNKFGCCLNFDFVQLYRTNPAYRISRELATIWEMCAFDVSDTCQLAIPRLSESLPTTKCPESDRFIGIGQFTFEGICKNHLGFTQQFVDEAYRSTCSQSKLLGLNTYFYCENSEDLGYCRGIRNSTFSDLITTQCG